MLAKIELPDDERQMQLINIVRNGIEEGRDFWERGSWDDLIEDDVMTWDEYHWCHDHLNIHIKVTVSLK